MQEADVRNLKQETNEELVNAKKYKRENGGMDSIQTPSPPYTHTLPAPPK